MKFEVISKVYRVEVPTDKFAARLTGQKDDEGTDGKTLGEKLEALPGVFDVRYNGHFGPRVFFSIRAESDTLFTKQDIEMTIRRHLVWYD
jgi:hypothetical protein